MSAKIKLQNIKTKSLTTKRGDTIIEVMFAIAVFSLVAVITISMMNLGTANAEGSLELTTARHELNAQAEALRFIHSAYTAELALPECSSLTDDQIDKGEKCQQYNQVWKKITKGALSPVDLDNSKTAANRVINISDTLSNNDTSGTLDYGKAIGCARAYQPISELSGKSLLVASNAFILNVRNMNVTTAESRIVPNNSMINRVVISATNTNVSTNIDTPGSDIKFTPAPLSARILYASEDDASKTTDDGYAARNQYNQVVRAEGIWVVAIAGEADSDKEPPFYDFYIQTCWNAPNSLAPTILDTVIRLYNPGAKS